VSTEWSFARTGVSVYGQDCLCGGRLAEALGEVDDIRCQAAATARRGAYAVAGSGGQRSRCGLPVREGTASETVGFDEMRMNFTLAKSLLSGRQQLTPKALENTLNVYAQQGWRLDQILDAIRS
jgi:hypothetical protein